MLKVYGSFTCLVRLLATWLKLVSITYQMYIGRALAPVINQSIKLSVYILTDYELES